MGLNILTVPDGKLCDYIDGKFRDDTPEEYVRQTIEKRLVNEHKYSLSQIGVECVLQIGSKKPRADIAIWEKGAAHTQEAVKIIIECKKEAITARDAKDGIDQLKSYMSVCPNCEWGLWTNSIEKFVFRKCQDSAGRIQFMEYNDIPSADGNLDDINRPSRSSLLNASDNNLLFVFRTCHNHIYCNDGMQKQPAFFELLKVIFCKIEDERNIPAPLEFFTTSQERSNPDGQLTARKRISKIFERVKKHYGKIFDANEEIKLTPRSLAYVVSELQRYSLLNTNIDIKGKAYEEIVGANLRGDRGEFFTPRNVMKMVVKMIAPGLEEKVLDSSCGTGGFLVTAMNHVIERLEKEFSASIGKKRADFDNDTLRLFQNRLAEIASSNFFGFDINPDLVKATKMNMVMNNDGSGNIFQVNSLLPPHEWPDEFKTRLDASYHVPIVNKIIKQLKKRTQTLLPLGDHKISRQIILPGRFKRVYVDGGGYGRVFIGGKQIHELDPSNKKYLSLSHHAMRIANELELHENMILITCSGTIGKVALTPKHWENWTASQHIIRIVPISTQLAGYLYTFLASEYAFPLISHYTYGAVVDEIDNKQVARIPIPLLNNQNAQKQINDLALAANKKRYGAYKLEQKALAVLNEEVINP